VAREVPGAGERIAAVCTGHDYSRPGKPKIDWDDPAAKNALVSALVNDADALVAELADEDLAEPAASAVALLALVAGQTSDAFNCQAASPSAVGVSAGKAVCSS
jgi:hypothetical protein